MTMPTTICGLWLMVLRTRSADSSKVLVSSMVIVIGPTPPGRE